MRFLRDRLNRCIFKLHYETALSDPWWDALHVLDVKRVSDYLQTSVFIAALWVGDAESAMYEHMDRLNFIKIKLDQYVDLEGASQGKVSDWVVKLWVHVTDANGVDLDNLFQGLDFLGRILCLSNPLKLRHALEKCGTASRADICRLYSEDMDTAVGLLSMQIEIEQKRKFSLLA
jgi:hypothetical protein